MRQWQCGVGAGLGLVMGKCSSTVRLWSSEVDYYNVSTVDLRNITDLWSVVTFCLFLRLTYFRQIEMALRNDLQMTCSR